MHEANAFIKAWRLHRGLKVDQLAKAAGYHRSYISRVEKGERRYDQHFLERVAEALHCRPADLITDPAEELTPAEREAVLAFLKAIRAGAATRQTGDNGD